jgi:toxin ParE1/3/4
VARYELSKAADEDLSNIYAYTFQEFGERQADAYFDALEESLIDLASNPDLGRDVSFVRSGFRLFVHQRHSIYYKPLRSGIIVIRVLGPGMSPRVNLP